MNSIGISRVLPLGLLLFALGNVRSVHAEPAPPPPDAVPPASPPQPPVVAPAPAITELHAPPDVRVSEGAVAPSARVGAPPDSIPPASSPVPEATSAKDPVPEIIDLSGPDPSTFSGLPASQSTVNVGEKKLRYTLNFFGDTGGGMGNLSGAYKPEFSLGSYSVLLSADLEKDFRALVETALEFDEANHPAMDAERLLLRYVKDRFYLQAGRGHIDVGYWNAAFHHGAWKHLSIERPLAVSFEDSAGGLFPAHAVGVEAGGALSLGSDKTLWFIGGIGNGRGSIVDDIQNLGDAHSSKEFYGKIELRGVGARALRFGVSGLANNLGAADASTRPALPDREIFETVAMAHVAYPGERLTLLAEALWYRHRGPATWNSYSGYALLGYAFPPFTPYAKLDVVQTNTTDPYFRPDPKDPLARAYNVVRGTAGLRYDMTNWASAKAEYSIDQYTQVDELAHELRLSWAFGI